MAQNALNRAEKTDFAPYKSIEGLEYFDKVIDINQSPIGRTPRSNPATYTAYLPQFVNYLRGVPEARARGITQDVLALTCVVDVVKHAKVMAC